MGIIRDFFIKESTEDKIEELENKIDIASTAVLLAEQVQEGKDQYELLQRSAEDLGWQLLNSQYSDYMSESGGDKELSFDNRIKRNIRAERMYREEALIRRAVNISNEYVWGRGMQKPSARDPRVQRVIDAFWADPDNGLAITTLAAQIETNIDLELHGELFFVVFDEGSWGDLGIDVTEIKNNPNKQNSLRGFSDTDQGQESYLEEHLKTELAHESSFEYVEDFSGGSFKVEVTGPVPDCPVKISKFHPNQISNVIRYENQGLKTKYFRRERPRIVYDYDKEQYVETTGKVVQYYENFSFPVPSDDEGENPPENKIGKGKVLHCTVNKSAFASRGNSDIWPSMKWARLLNDYAEMRMTLLKARAAFAYKRKVKGGPSAVLQSAARMMNTMTPGSRYSGTPGDNKPIGIPAQAGSVVTENESENLEQFQIKGDSGDAAGDILWLRSQTGLGVGLPAWYLGDSQGSNLANSTAMEFPVLKRFSARQEFFEKIIETLLDHAIQKAVEEGLIPESADLTYKNDLPNIQERNVPELVNAINQIVSRLDPFSMNYKLKRFLLLQGLIYLGINNPQKIVEDIYPPEAEREETEKMMSMGMLGGAGFTGQQDTQPEIPKSELDPMKNKKQKAKDPEVTKEADLAPEEFKTYEKAMDELMDVLDKLGKDEIERIEGGTNS